jgi:putative transposase
LECLTATDFLSIEVCTMRGLVTYYILFFIDLASRSVHIAGITPHPVNSWMTQVARNVTDIRDGFLRGKRHLILDRDTKYSDGFRGIITRAGTESECSRRDDLREWGFTPTCDHAISVSLPW